MIAKGDVLLLELGARDGHGYEAQTGKPIVFGTAAAGLPGRCSIVSSRPTTRSSTCCKPGCTADDSAAPGKSSTDRGYTVVAPYVHGVFNPLDAGPFVGTSHRPTRTSPSQPGWECASRSIRARRT